MKLQVSTQGDREILFTRAFQAPRKLVWDSHTKPELVRRWLLGPDGWSMPVCEIDLCVGGAFRYEWHNPDGRKLRMSGEFQELTEPARIVHIERFDEAWSPGDSHVTTLFDEAKGVTTMTMTVRFASAEARAGAMESGMTGGMEAGYVRLDDLFAAQAQA